MSNLLIVESPAKADTIEDYLPSGYYVRASYGHIRDLPKNKSEMPEEHQDEDWASLGVNTETFEPVYVNKKEDKIRELKGLLDRVDHIYLATDQDREGEAISWHLVDVLDPSVPVDRITFHEITPSAIQEAINNPRDIDEDLVRAQESRRILDRLIGYPLSNVLGDKIKWGLSAGRVQSVVTKYLVERELDRYTFESSEYWDLEASFEVGPDTLEATLEEIDDKPLASSDDFNPDTGKLKTSADVVVLPARRAKALASKIQNNEFTIEDISIRSYASSPAPPFVTSTLQRKASSRFNLSSSQTMQVAQRLYEDGHITYMRTDDPSLSDEARQGARNKIKNYFSGNFLSKQPNFYSSSGSAEEAHEAIRPAGKKMKHGSEKPISGLDEKVYNLIWERTLASQMKDAQKRSITVTLETEYQDHTLRFQMKDKCIDFPGYIRAYVSGNPNPDSPLLDLSEGDVFGGCDDISGEEHHTRPPRNYSEPALVKKMKKEGVGRPSTYSATLDKLTRDNRYAWKEGKKVVPNLMSFAVMELLEEHVPELLKAEFTADMESTLDEIASGQLDHQSYLKDFFFDDYDFFDRVDQTKQSDDNRAKKIEYIPDLPEDMELWVGQYGPYAKFDLEESTESVDIPDQVALSDLDFDELRARAIEQSKEDDIIVDGDPAVYLRSGQYGPYLQKGDEGETVSVPDELSESEVDEMWADRLFDLPLEYGKHSQREGEITGSIGRYGPYVTWKEVYVNVDLRDLWSLDFDGAESLIEEELYQVFDDEDEDQTIFVMDGQYGPYLKIEETGETQSIPDGTDPNELELADVREYLS